MNFKKNFPDFFLLSDIPSDDNKFEDKDRMVILHTKTGTIFEIIDTEDYEIDNSLIKYNIEYVDCATGDMEYSVAIVLHTVIFDTAKDKNRIIEEVLKPFASVYEEYKSYLGY